MEGEESRTAARNAQRMFCVNAVQFLAALGIKDFPVYGLLVDGSCGSLSQAWVSAENHVSPQTSVVRFVRLTCMYQCCHIIDRVSVKYRFDLSTNEGIVRYAAFLGAMKGHAEELRSRFESVRESIVERLSTDKGRESLRWTFHAQIMQYPLESDNW